MEEIGAAAFQLAKCEEIIDIRFWEKQPSVVAQSLLTTLLISLKDILTFLDTSGFRLSFVELLDGGDITDAIRNMRDTACHTTSGKRRVFRNGTKVSFYIVGPMGRMNLI
jgi:hypothetical protein